MSLQSTQDSARDSVITMPDPWAAWPWTRRVNPFHASVKEDSTAWVRSYKPYTPEAQRKFELCDNALLASLAFPDLNQEQLRLACDFIQLLFVFDDRVEKKDEQSAKIMASALMSGLRDGADVENDICAAMARDFWQRLVAEMPNTTYQRRFVAATQDYTDAVVEEARYRHSGHIPSVPEYFVLRGKTSAMHPCWVFLYMGVDLPEAVFDDPVVREIERVATDMVIVCNDIVSYKPEASRGHKHNLIAVLKELRGLSVQEAVEWAAKKGNELMVQAQDAKSRLPRFGGDVDRNLAHYVESLCNWARACDSWSFEGQRYFGDDTPRARKTRQVVLHAAVDN